MIHPKQIECVEDFPAGVASYIIRAKQVGSGTLLAQQTYPCTGSNTIISIGDNGFYQLGMEGLQITLSVQEVGSVDGTLGPEQVVKNPDNSPKVFVVLSDPNGCEDIIVTY